MDMKILSAPDQAIIKFDQQMPQEMLNIVTCHLDFKQKITPSPIQLHFSFPASPVYSHWTPAVYFNRGIRPSWEDPHTFSRLGSGAPVVCFIANDNTNLATIALSDATSPHKISYGYEEESGEISVTISLFALPVAPIERYQVSIRIDTRPLPFFDTIPAVETWWSQECGYPPAFVPDAAKRPTDSLWYSFHQNLNVDAIINECIESKRLGMDTVIIDEGWETDDGNPGFVACGDWEPSTSKIPNMADLVKRLHEIGMKVMLWFSVPFIGLHSKNFERFQGMLLNNAPTSPLINACYLDPRYKEVRDFLTETYASAIQNYGLDGLKLDFIDNFCLYPESMQDDPARDIYSLEDGMDALFAQIMGSLQAINPDIMIEFRQTYIGPHIRRYGNMLRVGDCPGDPLRNKLGVFDLRLLSGKTAVHSDPITWSKDAPAEYAALQLLNVFFSVPQISLQLPYMPQDHKTMLQHYLRVWNEHRSTLLDGKLRVYDPESNYTLATACKDGELFAIRYEAVPLTIEQQYDRILLINAKDDRASLIDTHVDLSEKVCLIYDCMGRLVKEIHLGHEQIIALPIPVAGMAVIS